MKKGVFSGLEEFFQLRSVGRGDRASTLKESICEAAYEWSNRFPYGLEYEAIVKWSANLEGYGGPVAAMKMLKTIAKRKGIDDWRRFHKWASTGVTLPEVGAQDREMAWVDGEDEACSYLRTMLPTLKTREKAALLWLLGDPEEPAFDKIIDQLGIKKDPEVRDKFHELAKNPNLRRQSIHCLRKKLMRGTKCDFRR